MTEPTDAELWQLYMQQPGQHKDPIDFARAALAKWGQPAQAAEPVAWLRNTTDQIADYVADNWPMRKYDLSEIEQRLRMLASAPSGPARVPLTDAQIRAMLNKHPPEDVCGWSYRMGIDDAELHHGIKGGQHGAE